MEHIKFDPTAEFHEAAIYELEKAYIGHKGKELTIDEDGLKVYMVNLKKSDALALEKQLEGCGNIECFSDKLEEHDLLFRTVRKINLNFPHLWKQT